MPDLHTIIMFISNHLQILNTILPTEMVTYFIEVLQRLHIFEIFNIFGRFRAALPYFDGTSNAFDRVQPLLFYFYKGCSFTSGLDNLYVIKNQINSFNFNDSLLEISKDFFKK